MTVLKRTAIAQNRNLSARFGGPLLFFNSVLETIMAQIQITAYPILAHSAGMTTISMGLGDNHPRRTAEIKTVTDCERELDAFAKEMAATGKPWRVSVFFPRQAARKPAGFDKAKDENRLIRDVNLHLAPAQAA